VDHGSDFTSRHLEQVAIDLKIRLVFSRQGKPLLTGQSLDRLPVTQPHPSRPAWPGLCLGVAGVSP